MTENEIITRLSHNGLVFKDLLDDVSAGQILYKPEDDQWCLLEVVCHLADEEVHDFRARCLSTIEDPSIQWPAIGPQGWVKLNKYMDQDFKYKVKTFLSERKKSVVLLRKIENPRWSNTYEHPRIGSVTARMMLHNWLMHDYLHIRQIHRLKTEYFRTVSAENLAYAGNW